MSITSAAARRLAMTAEEPPHEAVSPARPATRGAPDAPPPQPPRELEPAAGWCRAFDVEGTEWIARAAGRGAGGTGSYGLGMLEAVHFAHAEAPSTPLFEALVAAGRLAFLYDDELRSLLHTATRIVTVDDTRPEGRGGRGLGDD
jgi:hypothetical protein